jgi:hypothetical protein
MTRHHTDKSTSLSAQRKAFPPLRVIVRCMSALLALTVTTLHGTALFGQEIVDARKEYNVKAVTLYAFGRYVTWPASTFQKPDSPFVIGVLGDNPFGDALEQIAAKKTIAGRPIVIRPISTPNDSLQCHILFVTAAVSPEIEAKIFKQVAGKPVLLVGESKGFADRGGIVNFYESGTTVRFELNPDKANEAQLSFDAKLLSLGTKVPSRK